MTIEELLDQMLESAALRVAGDITADFGSRLLAWRFLSRLYRDPPCTPT